MRCMHLAIPSARLEDSIFFYEQLGCKIGRKTRDQAIVDFFGCQLVIHKSKDWVVSPKMYPRHFGVVFETKDELWALYLNKVQMTPYLRERIFEGMFTRHEGLDEEHSSFFLKDPSNELVEFKWYKNPEKVFS